MHLSPNFGPFEFDEFALETDGYAEMGLRHSKCVEKGPSGGATTACAHALCKGDRVRSSPSSSPSALCAAERAGFDYESGLTSTGVQALFSVSLSSIYKLQFWAWRCPVRSDVGIKCTPSATCNELVSIDYSRCAGLGWCAVCRDPTRSWASEVAVNGAF